MTLLAAALALLLPAQGMCAPSPRQATAQARRWACFYGANLSQAAWKGLDLAVVDPDNFSLPGSSGPVKIAYVSAGEADERRSFWPEAAGKSYIVEPNPDWKGAHRVDIRDPAWRRLLLDKVVPAALGKGYDGVMLDTLDVASYLESSAPVRFAESNAAAANLVLELRGRHPKAVILINNGLALLDLVGDAIDGVLVEDLYTRCMPSSPACGPAPEAEASAKEAVLRAFSRKTGKPVFVLLYARLSERDARWVRRAAAKARAAGFRPYLAAPTLERFGDPDPR